MRTTALTAEFMPGGETVYNYKISEDNKLMVMVKAKLTAE